MISFKSVGQFIEDLLDRQTANRSLGESDLRLASAALLVHTVAVDGKVKESEMALLKQLLSERFKLSEDELHELIIAAERREREAVDLYGFTSLIKSKTTMAERLKIIEMMWRLVFADGEVDAFEDNLVWRAAELLGVDARDRIMLKKLVESGQVA
jgi:uncharacterized tellurite resistance protein B-like protein